MKKLSRIITLVCMSILCVVGIVNAANTGQTSYSFYNQNTVGYSEVRSKDNTSKVYIHPMSGQTMKYTVQGQEPNNTYTRVSNQYQIPIGVEAIVTNYAVELGLYRVRLQFNTNNNASSYTSGKWSPDSFSTGNYTTY